MSIKIRLNFKLLFGVMTKKSKLEIVVIVSGIEFQVVAAVYEVDLRPKHVVFTLGIFNLLKPVSFLKGHSQEGACASFSNQNLTSLA